MSNMDSTNFLRQCWSYYLTLEEDFKKIERYITFETDNMNCFSIEFLKQYQTICSEIDVICKMYCEFLSPEDKRNNILHYANVILLNKKDFSKATVKLMNHLFALYPWKDWTCNHSNFEDGSDSMNRAPKWWNLYNKVKHQRLDDDSDGIPYYKRATLGNTVNALAALFVLEMNFYKDIVILEKVHDVTVPGEASNLFIYSGWENHIILLSNGVILDTSD